MITLFQGPELDGGYGGSPHRSGTNSSRFESISSAPYVLSGSSARNLGSGIQTTAVMINRLFPSNGLKALTTHACSLPSYGAYKAFVLVHEVSLV